MATNVTTTVLNEGASKVVVQFLIESDGQDGELINQVVLDPSTLFNPNLDPSVQLAITQIWTSSIWFDVLIRFNAIQPVTAWVLHRDGFQYHDFRYFGGIKDRSDQNHDGKVLFTTNGMDGTTLSVGTIVIEFRKN